MLSVIIQIENEYTVKFIGERNISNEKITEYISEYLSKYVGKMDIDIILNNLGKRYKDILVTRTDDGYDIDIGTVINEKKTVLETGWFYNEEKEVDISMYKSKIVKFIILNYISDVAEKSVTKTAIVKIDDKKVKMFDCIEMIKNKQYKLRPVK